jgi:hypothetical protein
MNSITLKDLVAMGVESLSVKDNSARGISVKYTSEIVVGDKVVIDNHFTLVTE